jgi:hypothetical protein
MKERLIRTETLRIAKSQTIETNCNAYTVTRKVGSAAVSVNNYPLDEGESKTFGGNIGDFYTTPVNVVFDTVGTKELYVDRRFEEPLR